MSQNSMATIGILGGSGIYNLEGLPGRAIELTTPYGDPSSAITEVATKFGRLLFLTRHGVGHRWLPSEVNYRANIFALKMLGTHAVVSLSAVGSLREDIPPGSFVLPDQYFDRTAGLRPRSFFGNGAVGHAPMAEPTCATLRAEFTRRLTEADVPVQNGGTYVCIEGPQFSTRSESESFRALKDSKGKSAAVIGMTAMPEARLAREAGLCYATVAMSTDYDCWHQTEAPVSVEAVLEVLRRNAGRSQALVRSIATEGLPLCDSGCGNLMKYAVVTPQELWPTSVRESLAVVLAPRSK